MDDKPLFSLESEQCVIGGLLIESQHFDIVSSLLSSSDFYHKAHRTIYRAISVMFEKGESIDVITLFEFLEREGEADNVGGLAYIGEMAKNTPGTTNIEHYAKVVRERALMRELVRRTRLIEELVKKPNGRDFSKILSDAESSIMQLSQGQKTADTAKSIDSYIKESLEVINRAAESDSGITGLSTGFDELDEQTLGFHKGNLIIIAGRPSMGKTALAMNIAEHNAFVKKKKTLVFSMEMPSMELLMRNYASIGGIPLNHIRSGKMSDEEMTALSHSISLLKENPYLFVDDTGGLTPSELAAKSRRIAHEEGGIDLIVVDYLQLMQVPEVSENRTLEIGFVSRSLKALAKNLNVPIIALSQLNRSLEQRQDKRPVMSDLRESGAIEQDADIITFVYRDEVYNKISENQGVAELIIAKQRNGPTGTVYLKFEGLHCRFLNK